MKKCAKLFMSCAILSGAVFLSAKDIATHRTTGTLTFEVRTTSYDGEYEPDNSGAIWVMNSSNQFVKTLKLWANSRKRHLVKWNDDTNGNEVDAVTGATVSSHRVHTATWDGTDIHGVDAPDGEYNIRVEMTEDNSDSGNTPDGPWHNISFDKGTNEVDITPSNASNFVDMSLTFIPTVATDNVEIPQIKLMQNYPNPFKIGNSRNSGTKIAFSLSKEDKVSLYIYDLKGRIVKSFESETFSAGEHSFSWNGRANNGSLVSSGTYFYKLKSKNSVHVKKAVIVN